MSTKIVDNLIYEVGPHAAFLIGYDFDAVDNIPDIITVPPHIDGTFVTGVAKRAFAFKPIKNIRLPNSISIIGQDAFMKSKIEGVEYYTTPVPLQIALDVASMAFYQCDNLKRFVAQQFVNAEYLSFAMCPKLKNFGTTYITDFLSVHERAFDKSGVEVIYLANNGWLRTNALSNSSVKEIHLKDAARIPAKTMEYIRKRGIKLCVYPFSPLLDLIHDGYWVEEDTPF